MKTMLLKTAIVGWMLAALVMIGAGCESVPTGESAITLNYTSLAETGRVVVVFEPAGTNLAHLLLPLRWSVSHPDLGTIIHSAGVQAVYAGRGVVGLNIVTVRDQGHAEGLIAVNHVRAPGFQIDPVESNLAIDPDQPSTLRLTATATVQNPDPARERLEIPDALALPLEWSVSDPALGEITHLGNREAVYTSTDQTGDNIVTVRDQMGAAAIAIIRQR